MENSMSIFFNTYIKALACGLILLIINSFVLAQATPVDIKKLQNGEAVLRVGIIKDYPPFYIQTPEGEKGMSIDIFKEIVKKAGIKKFNFVLFNNISDMWSSFNDKKIDMAELGVDTPEYEKKAIFSIPYDTSGGEGYLYDKDNTILKNVDNLKYHQIGVLRGSYSQRYWLPEIAHVPPSSIKAFNSARELVTALHQKQVDVIVAHYTFLRYQQYLSKHKYVAVLVRPIKTGFIFQKENTALRNLFNQFLYSMWNDHSLYKIKSTYLNSLDIKHSRTLSHAKE